MLIIFLTYSLQKLFAAGSSKALGTVGPSFYLKRCCDHFVTTFYEYNGKTPKESREKSCQKRCKESGKEGSQESGIEETPPLGLAYWLGNTKKDLQPPPLAGFCIDVSRKALRAAETAMSRAFARDFLPAGTRATFILMRLIVKTTNITLTPAMAQYLTDKLSDVARLLKRVGSRTRTYPGGRDVLEARVEVGKTTRHHKKGPYFYAEVNIDFGGKQILRAEAYMPTFRFAVDAVKKELKATILSWKERIRDRSRQGARNVKERMRTSRR